MLPNTYPQSIIHTTSSRDTSTQSSKQHIQTFYRVLDEPQLNEYRFVFRLIEHPPKIHTSRMKSRKFRGAGVGCSRTAKTQWT